jgi:predicted HTH transcriptional regulator
MLPEFPSNNELMEMNAFPYSEGYQWEFKENVPKSIELTTTVCAFLNTRGGYMVIGIRDKDLAICGIPESSTLKHIDTLLLVCDDIYHQGLILHEDGTRLPQSIVTAELRMLPDGRRIVIICVKPEAGKTYVRHCGRKYIRLAASNYRMSVSRYYTENDLVQRERSIRRHVMKEYSDLINGLYQEITCGADKGKELKCEVEHTQKLLHQKILDDKARVEKGIHEGGWSIHILSCRILCCVSPLRTVA